MSRAAPRRPNRYRVEVLEAFRVLRHERAVHLRPSAQRLVAGLAVLGPMARESLSARLWPDHHRDRALGNVRTVLWRLRTDAAGLIREDPSLCVLDAVVDLDVIRDWAAGAPDRPVGACDVPPPAVASELLPHWDEEWLVDAREELRMLRLRALEACGQRLLGADAFADAATCGRIALRIDPLRETSVRLLVQVHLREGNQVEALRQYRRYCDLLAQEMGRGVAPSSALTELVAEVFRPGVRPTR
ncbi:AfsR/SARP family transcriptional regulator [Geodermatophilus nigrescens]